MFQQCNGAGKLEYCTGSFCDPVAAHARTQFGLWAVMGAPLLLSFDVAAIATDELESIYGNPEIVAVSQDADEHGHGSPGGRRVSGGDFVEAADGELDKDRTHEPFRAGPGTVAVDADASGPETAACGPSTFNTSATGIRIEGLTCTDANSSVDCVAACCRAPGCVIWQWNPKYGPARCDHSQGVHGACWLGSHAQGVPKRALDWTGGSRAPIGPKPPPPPSPTTTLNVWARNLHDGGVAIMFINNGADAARMACDGRCIKATGLEGGQRYKVRDLFGRADLGPMTVDADAGFAAPTKIDGDGGSLLIKLTLA